MPDEIRRALEDPNRMLRLSTVALLLDVSDKTVRRYIAEGKLPAYNLAGGSNLRCRYCDVMALLTLKRVGLEGEPMPDVEGPHEH